MMDDDRCLAADEERGSKRPSECEKVRVGVVLPSTPFYNIIKYRERIYILLPVILYSCKYAYIHTNTNPHTHADTEEWVEMKLGPRKGKES